MVGSVVVVIREDVDLRIDVCSAGDVDVGVVVVSKVEDGSIVVVGKAVVAGKEVL